MVWEPGLFSLFSPLNENSKKESHIFLVANKEFSWPGLM
jgi:hypothetical protein